LVRFLHVIVVAALSVTLVAIIDGTLPVAVGPGGPGAALPGQQGAAGGGSTAGGAADRAGHVRVVGEAEVGGEPGQVVLALADPVQGAADPQPVVMISRLDVSPAETPRWRRIPPGGIPAGPQSEFA
jgi:hypothetical protein